MSFRKAPVTWILIFLNVTMTVYATHNSPRGLEDLMRNTYFVRTQGRLYAEFLAEKSKNDYSEMLLELSRQVLGGEADSKDLGELAFRDPAFIRAADTMESAGDQVAFRLWKKNLLTLEDIEDRHPSFTLGLSARDTSLDRWVSYIFVHSGWLHCLGNMLILMIFGAALEAQIGGLAMLVVFLLTGVFAAGVFATLTGVANSPLVGASGSISGIMALYCVLNWSKPARYFYWFFLPFRGYMGLIYLPAWVGLMFWAANDLAGYFATPPELGGVAHTAHLGGEVAGALAGLILFGLRRFWPVKMKDSVPPGVPMGVLIPFLPPVTRKSA
ncbi:MAG: rhomboid family intramembrane serine protease [Bdellovibrionales bacterium]|nr:rhomboid family intramembrane serine protease [Bdellovibrionales bacterium]